MSKVPAFESEPYRAKIKVIGIGDTGCRIVNKMIREQNPDIEFIAINAEVQAQGIPMLAIRIPIDWEEGFEDIFWDADMVLLMASMEDYLETVLVAETSRECGNLTIAIVTTPFSFEGKGRSKVAEKRINRLLHEVDSLFIIYNDRLVHVSDHKISMDSALWVSDYVVGQTVRAIAGIITVPGSIQLDLTDFKAVMKNAGPAWMSVGRGTGCTRASDAVKDALGSPLLDASIHSSKAVLFKIVGGADLTLYDVNQAAEIIRQAVDPEANIIFGVDRDPIIGNEVRITLIGTAGKDCKLSTD